MALRFECDWRLTKLVLGFSCVTAASRTFSFCTRFIFFVVFPATFLFFEDLFNYVGMFGSAKNGIYYIFYVYVSAFAFLPSSFPQFPALIFCLTVSSCCGRALLPMIPFLSARSYAPATFCAILQKIINFRQERCYQRVANSWFDGADILCTGKNWIFRSLKGRFELPRFGRAGRDSAPDWHRNRIGIGGN